MSLKKSSRIEESFQVVRTVALNCLNRADDQFRAVTRLNRWQQMKETGFETRISEQANKEAMRYVA
jgi:hypothetical protein